MKKSTKKWLIGSGIVAAGIAAAGAAFRTASKYLVKLAMDRECPKEVEKGITKVSGSPENTELMTAASEAMQKLENAGCETVEIQSHDGIRLVGHWHTCEQPKRIIVAMHGWRSSWSRDFGMIAPFWHESGCSDAVIGDAMRSAHTPKACIIGKACITHKVRIMFRKKRITQKTHLCLGRQKCVFCCERAIKR